MYEHIKKFYYERNVEDLDELYLNTLEYME